MNIKRLMRPCLGVMALAFSGFSAVYLWSSELFPTSLRHSAMGLGSMSARSAPLRPAPSAAAPPSLFLLLFGSCSLAIPFPRRISPRPSLVLTVAVTHLCAVGSLIAPFAARIGDAMTFLPPAAAADVPLLLFGASAIVRPQPSLPVSFFVLRRCRPAVLPSYRPAAAVGLGA